MAARKTVSLNQMADFFWGMDYANLEVIASLANDIFKERTKDLKAKQKKLEIGPRAKKTKSRTKTK